MSFLKKAVKGVGNFAKTAVGGKEKKRILIKFNVQSMTVNSTKAETVMIVWKRGSKETSHGTPFEVTPSQQSYNNLNQVFERESLFLMDKDNHNYSEKDCDIEFHYKLGEDFVLGNAFNLDMSPLIGEHPVQNFYTLAPQNNQKQLKNVIINAIFSFRELAQGEVVEATASSAQAATLSQAAAASQHFTGAPAQSPLAGPPAQSPIADPQSQRPTGGSFNEVAKQDPLAQEMPVERAATTVAAAPFHQADAQQAQQEDEKSEEEEEPILTEAEEKVIRDEFALKQTAMKQDFEERIAKVNRQTERYKETRRDLELRMEDLEKLRNESVTVETGKEKEYISTQRQKVADLYKKLEAEKKRKEQLHDQVDAHREIKVRLADISGENEAEKLPKLLTELKAQMASKQEQVEGSIAVKIHQRAYEIEFDDY